MRRSPIPACAVALAILLAPAALAARPDRVTTDDGPGRGERIAQAFEAVASVQHAHRTWPDANHGPRPALRELVPHGFFAEEAADAARRSEALRRDFGVPITGAMLQAELDRMARESRDPARLRELFAALGNDARLAAEVLARPALVERLLRSRYEARAEHLSARSFEQWWNDRRERLTGAGERESVAAYPYRLPEVTAAASAAPQPQLCNSWDDPVPMNGRPAPRYNHVAVWTGSEMLVWSGADAEGYGQSALFRYDPAMDVWRTSRDQADAPSGRSYAVAVWTGTEMVVWGGWSTSWSGSFPLNDGGRYDPVTDHWTRTSTAAPCPSPRSRHTGIWTGSRLIVWGGLDWNGQGLNDGGAYDPATDTWTATTTTAAPPPRADHTAVWTGSEMIVYGGSVGSIYYSDFGRYSPSTDSWLPAYTNGFVPGPRTGHTAVWTGSKMIMWGGRNRYGVLRDGAALDLGTHTWTQLNWPGAPAGRYLHVAQWVPSRGEMLVWGGSDTVNPLGDGSRYDPAADAWHPMAATGAPSPRSNLTAAWTGTEWLVWGGYDTGPLASGARYDPALDAWTPMVPVIGLAVSSHTAVWTGSEMLVWGGRTASGASQAGASYVPATARWTAWPVTANTPAARYDHAAVWTGTEMMVWGGSDGTTVLSSGGLFDPVTRAWRPTSGSGAVPPGRSDFTMLWTGSRAIVWGGSPTSPAGNTAFNDGGVYDPVTDSWTPTSTGTGVPQSRYGHTAVWTGSEMIVWGGRRWGTIGDGGAYDPATDTWRPISTTGAPSARYRHVAAWDGQHMIVASGWSGLQVNGGYVTGGVYTLATDSWTPTASTTLLWNHEYAAAAWTGRELVIWGGERRECTDFCSWNVSSSAVEGARYDVAADAWSPLPGISPPARRSHTAVWTGDTMLVWGGTNVPSDAGAPTPFSDGGVYAQVRPGSPGDTLRVTKSATVDLAWTATSGSTGYPVRRCTAGPGPCTPTGTIATAATPAYSEPIDQSTYFYVVDASNDCGVTP